MKFTFNAVTLLSLLLSFSAVQAAPITMKVTVAVDYAFIYGGDPFAGASVSQGDTIVGYYTYDPDTADAYPSDPGLGSYYFSSAPMGWSVDVNGTSLESSYDYPFIGVDIYDTPGWDTYHAISFSNAPAADGSDVYNIKMYLDSWDGSAIDSDVLTADLPVLNDWDRRFFTASGQNFVIEGTVTNIEPHEVESPLTISPADGAFLPDQSFDVSLILPNNNNWIFDVSATLNGVVDVSWAFWGCWHDYGYVSGRASLYCPNMYSDLYLQPGINTLDITATLDDFSTLQNSVRWEILPSASTASGLTISPASGTFLAAQWFESSLLLPDTSRMIMDVDATFNGTDNVSWAFDFCMPEYGFVSGRSGLYCPSLLYDLFVQLGVNTLDITVTLDDASTMQNSVQWEILP